ncbi:helix-turn-helix transcriptional regulator [Anaerocolumna aminovalerica]|uniref:helix-turn-helix domain-containing protein n=1 Tax=Anaerocolumna aminovalerica TaxID=1527 RepID=UPI001C0EA509|nr:helix-turn-helix transcriptional regulator [Anaerocolumna aminovalerica]MBU5331447.1 helix-turn-helix transcriptional regulator [Anaerocolumna aminovalerica]
MNDRVKTLRKTLKLSQEEFGRRLGIKKSSVSLIESGRNNLTDSMVKLICKEFNVSHLWLTVGKGNIFLDPDYDVMDKIDRIMTGENELHKNLFKLLASFDEDDLKTIDKMLDKCIDIFGDNKKAD